MTEKFDTSKMEILLEKLTSLKNLVINNEADYENWLEDIKGISAQLYTQADLQLEAKEEEMIVKEEEIIDKEDDIIVNDEEVITKDEEIITMDDAKTPVTNHPSPITNHPSPITNHLSPKIEISLTRKFEYINQLFGGEASLFNAFLNQVTHADKKESALALWRKEYEDRNWAKKAETAEDLKNLIHKAHS